MFGRSNDASVFKVSIGVVVFVATWLLFIVSASIFPALALWVFGVGFMGPYLKFVSFAYLAGMPVSMLALLSLRHKRRYLGEQRRKYGQHCVFASAESKGFISPVSNVLGVLLWPFAWMLLRERREEVSELLNQWFEW